MEDKEEPWNYDFEVYKATNAAHDNDPLDTEICVKIQRFTLERLQAYCKSIGQSLDEVINEAIKDCLDLEGA